MKKIIIAGSEGLIGSAAKKYLEEKGYFVVGMDLKLGHDFRDESLVKNFFNDHSDAYGLVNAFALNPQPSESSWDLYSLPLESFYDYMEVNVISLFNVCRAFSCGGKKQGVIVNFGSIYSLRSPKHDIYADGFTKHIGYSTSKAAVLGLSSYLATYLAPKIRVNTIIPGGIENGQDQHFQSNYAGHTPFKRMMKVNELLSAVDYFLSEKSSYTTGAVLNIDGGWSAW